MASHLFASPGCLLQSSAQALSPEESLAVVDIFINAAIACICHTRDLIPWNSACFKTRYIDDLHSEFWKNGVNKYSAFCDTEPTLPSNKSQEFRILTRGEDKRADGVLDLIESGVFQAVNRGFLEAMRFFITQGSIDCNPTDVLESYTLTFNYEDGIGDNRNVRSISLNSTPAFTTDNAIHSFKKAIKNLLTSLQGLPLMPRRRSVGVAMLYNKHCPTEYHEPGFLTEFVPTAPRQQSEWQKLLLQDTSDIGKFEVGPYKIVVGASNFRPSVELPLSSQTRGLRMSKQLQNLQNSSSQQRGGLVSTLDDPGPQNPQNTPATLSLLRSDAGNPPYSSQLLPRSSKKTGYQRSGLLKVQVMTRDSRKRNVIPKKIAEIIVQACALEANHKGAHIFDPKDLQQNDVIRLDTSLGGSMRCECYDTGNAGELLLCCLCGTSQHVQCYGWRNFPRVRLPDEHLCYSCLLLPQEAELNLQMPTLVSKRLALGYIQENTPAHADDLMDAMHLSKMQANDNEIFNNIIDELQHEGYLTRSGLMITSRMDKDLSATALRNYINPLARISHHFCAIKDGERLTDRVKAIEMAVKEYTGGQRYLAHKDSVDYNLVLVKDAFDEKIPRWGFYPTLVEPRKRKATTPSVEETPSAQRSRLGSGHDGTPEGDRTPPPYQLPTNRISGADRRQTPPPYQMTPAHKASYDEGTPPVDATPSPSLRPSLPRKASRCEQLVRLDRSSPSTVFSLDDVLAEAVHVATSDVQWQHFQ